MLVYSLGPCGFCVFRYFAGRCYCCETFHVLLHPNRSQDSSVSVVTTLQARELKNRVPTGSKSKAPIEAVRSTNGPKRYTGPFLPACSRPGREAIDVKNEWSDT